MFDQYKIAVKVALMDELSVPLTLVARHLAATEAAAAKLQSRLASMRNYFGAGVGLLGAGATLAAPLIYAVDKAAELQKQMIAVQIATRGTTQQMDSMRKAFEGIAAQTMFSVVDIAKMGKLVATGTGLTAPQVQALMPTYAKFADAQLLLKDTPYEKSVTEAIRLAHVAQHYDPASLGSYMDLLTKATLIEPGSLTEIGNALKYSQGVGKTAMGVDDKNMIVITAFLNRLGFAGTRGGTNFIAAMTRSIPGIFGSGLLTGKSGQALKDMDMVDASGHSRAFTDGKFDAFKWAGLLSTFVAREFARHPEAIARQEIMKDFQHAFGAQGNKMVSALSDPAALTQMRAVGDTFAQLGGVDQIQQTFANQSVAQQYMVAKTDFESAMTELGITLLPTATRFLRAFNADMGELIGWLQKHPGQLRQYAKDVAYFAAALIGLGAVSVATSGIIGLTTVVQALGRAAKGGPGAPGGPGVLGKVGTAAARFTWAGALYETIDSLWKGPDWLNSWSALGKKIGDVSLGPNLLNKTQGSPYVAPPRPQTINLTAPIYLDQRKIGQGMATFQNKALASPQVGPSFFDDSLMPVPAGGLGF